MPSSRSMFLPLLALLVVRFVFAAVEKSECGNKDACLYDYGCLCAKCEKTLNCQVCGYQGSSPYRCQAYNATFDSLTNNQNVTDYDVTTWSTPFLTATRSNANPIIPGSKKHYIRSTSGAGALTFTSGESDFGDNFGGLFNFDYACADACTATTSDQTAACNVTVTATCLSFSPEDQQTYPWSYNQTFSYEPSVVRYARMASGLWNSSDVNYDYNSSRSYDPAICSEYTFEATRDSDSPLFLYLDNVVVNSWTSIS